MSPTQQSMCIAVPLLVAFGLVAWQLAELHAQIDRVERLSLSTSCAVLRKLHWDDPTRPDCAESTEP